MEPAARLVADAIGTTRAALLKINRLENDLNSITLANKAFERRLSVYEPCADPPARLNIGLNSSNDAACGSPITSPSPPPSQRKGAAGRRSASVSLPLVDETKAALMPLQHEAVRLTEASPENSLRKVPLPHLNHRGAESSRLRQDAGPSSPGSSMAAHRIDCLEYLLKEERRAHEARAIESQDEPNRSRPVLPASRPFTRHSCRCLSGHEAGGP